MISSETESAYNPLIIHEIVMTSCTRADNPHVERVKCLVEKNYRIYPARFLETVTDYWAK